MGKRSSVSSLAGVDKKWLDEALVENDFARYRELEAALKERGYTISKSALQRYGTRFEQQLGRLKEAAEKARAVVAASPDDADDMSQALMRLTQAKLMEVMECVEVDPDKVDLGKLTLQISRLVRASVPLKKWQMEMRTKLQAETVKAAEEVSKTARKAGMSDETVELIKSRILGIDQVAPA